MATKLCIDCGVESIAVQALRCKECNRLNLNAKARERSKIAYANNPDKFKARAAHYYESHRDEILDGRRNNERISDYNKSYMPEYYRQNKDRLQAQNRANYYANIDSRKASNRRYRAENREKVLAAKREYYRANKDVLNAKMAEYIRRNPHISHARRQRRRAVKMGAAGRHTEDEWQAIVASQKGRCAHCGKKRKLEKDHRVPLSRGGTDFAFNIQGLCRSCNASKSNKIDSGDQHSLFDRMDKAA